MSDTYTIVAAPGDHASFAHNGTLSREQAIAKTRAIWRRDLLRLQIAMAMTDDELDVRVVRGINVQHLIKQL